MVKSNPHGYLYDVITLAWAIMAYVDLNSNILGMEPTNLKNPIPLKAGINFLFEVFADFLFSSHQKKTR